MIGGPFNEKKAREIIREADILEALNPVLKPSHSGSIFIEGSTKETRII